MNSDSKNERRNGLLLAAAVVTVAVHTAMAFLLWMDQEKEVVRPPEAITVRIVVPPKPVQPVPPRPKPVVKEMAIPQEVPKDPVSIPEPEPQIKSYEIPEETPPSPESGPVEEQTIIPMEEPPITPPLYNADYLNNPVPPYPMQAKRSGIEGVVVVRVLVSPSGLPEKVELYRTSGYTMLDEAALKAVKTWTFIPARQGNEPIAAAVDIPIRFHLN
jgi:protein TonB